MQRHSGSFDGPAYAGRVFETRRIGFSLHPTTQSMAAQTARDVFPAAPPGFR
jgi:hypothetical protein